jgi:hypothetical protein
MKEMNKKFGLLAADFKQHLEKHNRAKKSAS